MTDSVVTPVANRGVFQSMEEPSDATLVLEARRGETKAFAQLVHRYRDRHARFATRMLGDQDDAEDVLQSVFVRAFKHLDKCDDPARFGAWLHRIVVNECRTHATRRGHREAKLVRDDVVMGGISADTPDRDVVLREKIDRAVAALPMDQREAFLLKHVDGLEYEEMASVTGVGVSALKMRVKRAIDKLRERLGELADD